MAGHFNQFVWHDLSTLDMATATAFYTAVFGWSTQSDDPDYHQWANGKRGLGGMMILAEQAKAMGAPPNWMGYISVADVAAKAAQAQAAGATVYVPPTAIDGAGHFSVLADPQGGVFALYQSNRDYEQPEAGVGDFSWGELATDDLAAATAFYVGLFGWETQDTDMGGGWMYRLFKVPGGSRHLGGMFQKGPDMPFPTNWLHYITVSDIDAAVERIKAAGGAVMNGPMDVPGGDRVAQCSDDQGAGFGLHQSPATE